MLIQEKVKNLFHRHRQLDLSAFWKSRNKLLRLQHYLKKAPLVNRPLRKTQKCRRVNRTEKSKS